MEKNNYKKIIEVNIQKMYIFGISKENTEKIGNKYLKR